MGDRLLFKFYKSYFDVASELNDKDRLAFYDALMNKEFYNIEPDLKGMAKFAYISQKHSIDKQVEGWESKMKSQLIDPMKGGVVGGASGGITGPSIQEKEKEKEKGKEEYTKPRTVFTPPTLDDVISYFKEKGYLESAAKKAFDYYSAGNWKDSKGAQVKNWKQKMQGVWFKDENKTPEVNQVRRRSPYITVH